MFISLPQSLLASPHKDKILKIMVAALKAADPYQSVINNVQRDKNRVTVGERIYDLSAFQNKFLISVGKASLGMCAAMIDLLGNQINEGIVLTTEGNSNGYVSPLPADKIVILTAGHPLPDQRGLEASQRIEKLIENRNSNDLFICLISGGASALMTSPAEGISLSDLQVTTSTLLKCGASISEINTLRKHIEKLKGGKLARRMIPAYCLCLILSDVVGNPLDVIASGPTAPDSTTYQDALEILKRYHLMNTIPASILHHLNQGIRGKIQETPKPGDLCFENVHNTIVGCNRFACQAAVQSAISAGFKSTLLTTSLQGEAAQVGRFIAEIGREIATSNEPRTTPACIVAGGETTVHVIGDGLGGRNLEVALGAVKELAELEHVALVTLSTDGIDGSTNAAGAMVTGETLKRANKLGLNPEDFLVCNDSYHFFEVLGDLIITGPTGTNVNDLVLLFVF